MIGAQALIRTLTGCGVDVCFSNPGTSEMHFVAALDAVPQMRGVLCLFEGVATGAADGYGRMTGRPGRRRGLPAPGPRRAWPVGDHTSTSDSTHRWNRTSTPWLAGGLGRPPGPQRRVGAAAATRWRRR